MTNDQLKAPLNALYRVQGSNIQEGKWRCYVKAETPMQALERATSKHPWDILTGLHIQIELDFIDDE